MTEQQFLDAFEAAKEAAAVSQAADESLVAAERALAEAQANLNAAQVESDQTNATETAAKQTALAALTEFFATI
jgi:hypothetical protein